MNSHLSIRCGICPEIVGGELQLTGADLENSPKLCRRGGNQVESTRP